MNPASAPYAASFGVALRVTGGQRRLGLQRADVSKYIELPGTADYVLHFASPASPVSA